ncbi:GNAT family N-acetyltransferase [Salinigranum rubrum]|uniref:GNAT family N-acetyltransferase n=1 Tax=Salinigranum rubrum TaxID=755307 RepID=A0A2I8VPQ8_9EURY|nr:GNAT family N-acetyltransferase [Salinigranum rubrum]
MSLRAVDADASDSLDYVERLLARNDLPTADVRANPGYFFVAFEGEQKVGVGGIERFPPDGLLRSVVVEESMRGRGAGAALCDRLEHEAASDGVDTLYLLTTTAADFFAARGYERVDRADAPASIRGTSQFESLCPDTATVMRKRLSP